MLRAYTVSQFIVRAAAKTARDCIDSSEICFARNALKTKLILKTFPPAEHERENLVCSENNRETKNKQKENSLQTLFKDHGATEIIGSLG